MHENLHVARFKMDANIHLNAMTSNTKIDFIYKKKKRRNFRIDT